MDFRSRAQSKTIYTAHAISKAQELVLSLTRPLQAQLVPLHDALHATLAEAVKSTSPLPTFATAGISGYAIKAGGSQKDVEFSPLDAGVDPSKLAVDITANNAVYVNVGGVMPHGSNCVVPMGCLSENRTLGDFDLRPESITFKGNFKEGDNVRAIGSDIAEDQEILPAGHVINPTSIGLMASFGIFLVRVHNQPTVGIFSVGDEFVEIGEALHNRGQVRDCNKATLNSMFTQMRVACNDYGIVPMNSRLIEEKFAECCRKNDIVIAITAEANKAGDEDNDVRIVKEVVEEAGKVQLGRGAATKFGPRPSIRENGHSPRICFTVPSNAAICPLITQLLISPCIKKMRGVEGADCLPVVTKAVVKDDLVQNKNLTTLHRVNVKFSGGRLEAKSTGDQSATRMLRGKVKSGNTVECHLIDSGLGGAVGAMGLLGGGEVKVVSSSNGFMGSGFLSRVAGSGKTATSGVSARVSSMRITGKPGAIKAAGGSIGEESEEDIARERVVSVVDRGFGVIAVPETLALPPKSAGVILGGGGAPAPVSAPAPAPAPAPAKVVPPPIPAKAIPPPIPAKAAPKPSVTPPPIPAKANKVAKRWPPVQT
ncbi:hypothetical protein TL16_g06225 [Triparma laevis f. inornata]|uniref:MoeA N-terminal and linker domain-containing protein n=1 Tax=Triparma laevis f. inornata TaxID=1714386 RepID=A0A9W7ATC1_9STRA|nr:hypothetical protein TL16_g06225 [Triparma laevis f. inornata]